MNTLSYKLCKLLKEAGFPQELGDGTKLYDLGGGYHKWDYYSDKSYDLSKGGYYKIPTLEELIDACGDEFMDLLNLEEDGWRAFAKGYKKQAQGKTPREAVAKLYIKLQESIDRIEYEIISGKNSI